MNGLFTVKEVAEKLNMSEQFVRKLLKHGKIDFHQFGTSIKVKGSDIDKYIESNRVEAK